MLEKEQLRKADIFSGLAIFLFGLFIVLMASEMPMKDLADPVLFFACPIYHTYKFLLPVQF